MFYQLIRWIDIYLIDDRISQFYSTDHLTFIEWEVHFKNESMSSTLSGLLCYLLKRRSLRFSIETDKKFINKVCRTSYD